MLSGNINIEDDDWDSVRQGYAALTRDLERIYLSFGMGGNDLGGGVPKSANDQTVMQDGNYGYQAVTTDMLAELEDRLISAINASVNAIPRVQFPITIANGGTGKTNQQDAINALAGGVTNNRVLRGNGTNIVLSQVALATDVSGTLPVNYGGTGNTSSPDARIGIGCIKGVAASGSPWTSGTPSFVIPANVNRILAIAIGGGGAFATGGSASGTFFYVSSTSGGATNYKVTYSVTGSGGGHGGIAMAWVDVTPGETISMSIGSGGATGYPGGDGGSTTITFPSSGGVITASGGIGSYPSTPGDGGTVTSTVASSRNPLVLDLMATGGRGSDLLFKDSVGSVIGGWASSSAVPSGRSILPGTTYGAGSTSGAGSDGAVAIFY